MCDNIKICSIHQPNFFPWLGYFDKIARSDVFVFLDAVSYPKSSKTMATWINRVAINIQNQKQWISIPVVREDGVQYINQVRINTSDWREKLKKTISYNYSKADYYDVIVPHVFRWIDYDFKYVSDYNICIIKEISDLLGLKAKFVKQSDFHTINHSTRLLVEIVKGVDCDAYLCGGGASGYQEDSLFEENGVNLIYQNFEHPQYHQLSKEFIGGLSILDPLFNLGFDGVSALLKKTK